MSDGYIWLTGRGFEDDYCILLFYNLEWSEHLKHGKI